MKTSLDPRTQPAIRVSLLPRDTNGHGTIFGGVILSYIDQAGAIEAARITHNKIVTVAVKEVVFHKPVHVGDLVSFYTHVERIGRTSITIKVKVIATYLLEDPPQDVEVTEAQVVYVAVDSEGNPISIQ